jgi:LmbE family N-acetylglucosaminyl deacetylase
MQSWPPTQGIRVSRPDGRVARAARNVLDRRYRRPAPTGWLASSALVVAPHPDDETLGCGGTIALRRASGAAVHVAFLTDGTLSHKGRLPAADLAARRRREALDACTRLGVPSGAVHFLDYEDGHLAASRKVATGRLAELVDALRPAHVLVTSVHDGTPDHVAAAQIARAAASLATHRPALFEYPVWHWDRWPYSPWPGVVPSKRALREAARFLSRSVAAWWLPARLSGAFSVDVSRVLVVKAQALDAHQTQMQRPQGDPAWPVLGEVNGGAFLENLMGDTERFWPVRATTGRRAVAAMPASYDGAVERE